MAGYAKQRSNWQDFPVTSTPITAANLNGLETAIYDLKTLFYNVNDYGAKGDFSQNDESYCQAALDDCNAAGGGVVLFPKPNYLLGTTGALTYGSNTTIRGAGMGKTQLYQAAGTGPILKSRDTATNMVHVLVEDIALSAFGNLANNTGGLIFENTKFSFANRVQVAGTSVYGIKMLGGPNGGDTQDNTITCCDISSMNTATTVAILLASSTNSSADGALISGCIGSNSQGVGFKVDKGTTARGYGADFNFNHNRIYGTPTAYDIDGNDGTLAFNRFEIPSGAMTATIQTTGLRNALIRNTYAAPSGFTLTDNAPATNPTVIINPDTGTQRTTVTDLYRSLTYSATIATDASTGNFFSIVATNGTAFTISNPTVPKVGQKITYDIKNSSGGAMGVVTWGTGAFKLDATGFVNPANTKRKTISFYYDGTNWVQVGPTSADI